ncbi:MAG: hypothetical protein H6819_03710 [Phycisphaerales bacterium]|nr:hypothetical protein [Phycisphaerales bacterium]MCB9856304.1 hypothetical protein [Phycisphaerales bacterium]MCB9863257.1 hypothetical protein [Phycisphaerales bacterium]
MPFHPSRRRLSRSVFLHGLLFAVIALVRMPTPPTALADPPKRPHREAPADKTAAVQLRSRIKALLKDGRIDDAVRAAQSALRDAPEDNAIRREFIDLHLSLGRSWLAEERFNDALTALDAVLRVQPGQPDAALLKKSIDDARRSIPTRLAQAREWVGIEWFEPAFNAYRQAVALAPERRNDWLKGYRAAAIGAGDDDYITKNFHQAFYYYDAALKLGDEAGIRPAPAVVSRWMQSLVHALDDDNRVRYPAAYWKIIFERISQTEYTGPDAAALRATLEGLAFEHAGDAERAVQAYGRAVRPQSRRTSSNVSAARRAAIDMVRKEYNVEAIGRRADEWKRNDTEAMQLFESDRFRIHHRNAVVAQQVGRSLDFHFARIADSWALDIDEIPWETKADVYLHSDRHAFLEATGQSPPVTAISRIRMQGGTIQQKIIHVHLADPMLLSSSLAHELAHLMTAEIRRDRPLPAVIAEGLALNAEPHCRHRQFARLFEEQKQPASIRRLLAFDDVHPTDVSFYSAAHRLMTVLRTRSHPADLLALRSESMDAKELARKCGFADARQLQLMYTRLAPDENRARIDNQPGSTN